MKRISLYLLLGTIIPSILLSACKWFGPSRWVVKPEAIPRVDDMLTEMSRGGNFTGSILIAQNRKILLSHGYGLADRVQGIPNTPQTRFHLGSITKVFTGTLLAQAVVTGEVNLDNPISMYLPEGVVAPEYEGRSITLLDLATHTAGWAKWPGNLNKNDLDDIANYTNDRMYDFVSGYHLTRAPGSSFEYSNFGFGLLGNLLARRAGQADYEALLVDRIARPMDQITSDWAGFSLNLTKRFTGTMEKRLVTIPILDGILSARSGWWY